MSFFRETESRVKLDPDEPDQVKGHVASIPLSSVDICRSDTASCWVTPMAWLK